MKPALFVLLSAVCLRPVWGQIAQTHPEYCGLPGDVNPPPSDISASLDPQGHATLYIGRGNSARGILLMLDSLPSLISELTQVCPLSHGRMVVFADYVGTDLYIVDPSKTALVDSFLAYNPVISPDQRWIAYMKFYPRGVEGAAEYMIYDLTKTPTQNRPDGVGGSIDVGKVIFPPGHENFPASNTVGPVDQEHLGGTRLYWAADSRAILFGERARSGPGIVFITLDEKGVPSAFRHPLTPAEICGRDIPSGSPLSWRLDQVEIGPDAAGSRVILLDIGSGDSRCAPHVLQLHSEDFQTAKTEVHVRPGYTRGAIVDGKEVIPPKKEK
jgi:hypothetical protein